MAYDSPDILKKNLFSIISDMQTVSHLFVKQPEKDFSRNRKLSFADTIRFLLSMKGNTLRKEWLDFWEFSPNMTSLSAFCQQRQKLLPEAMDFLFHSFNDTFLSLDTYRGFRLLACDGSDLAIPCHPNDKETHSRHNSLERNEKGYNQLHLNALYDLKNRIYVDTIIQPGRFPNETKALIDMMERSKIQEPVLLVADRGYESYNIMAHAQEKGWKFLIRAKDLGRWGIERSFRELKYTIGLTNFYAKKVDYILQEIFARLIIYNFCEQIITNAVVQQKNRKHTYQINFTVAVLICREYFRNRIYPPDLEALILKNILPVREGRKAPRKVRPNSAVGFLYRIA